MNSQQLYLIRQTFAQIAPIAHIAAPLFYGRLFEIAPDTSSLFHYDLGSTAMAQQGSKLMQTLAVAVANVDQLETIQPALQALAQRHVAYGVEARHYDAVGSALLWTLEQGLGTVYTPEVHTAWAELYTTLAGVMQQAVSCPPRSRQVGM